MFVNKIDLPYCLVVFFVGCARLRPFKSVFGELALHQNSANSPKTLQNGLRRAQPTKNTTRQ